MLTLRLTTPVRARELSVPKYLGCAQSAHAVTSFRGSAAAPKRSLRHPAQEILEAIYAVPHRLIRDAALFDVLFVQARGGGPAAIPGAGPSLLRRLLNSERGPPSVFD